MNIEIAVMKLMTICEYNQLGNWQQRCFNLWTKNASQSESQKLTTFHGNKLFLIRFYRPMPKLLNLCSNISRVVSVVAGAGFCMVNFFLRSKLKRTFLIHGNKFFRCFSRHVMIIDTITQWILHAQN